MTAISKVVATAGVSTYHLPSCHAFIAYIIPAWYNMPMKDLTIIAKNDNIVLRDRIAGDVEAFIRWQTSGEWLAFDAPWEQAGKPEPDIQTLRDKFRERCEEKPETPRKSAMISLPDGPAIGWVNRYTHKGSEDAWLIGIDICEDECLNRGLGTQALILWKNYLFANSNYHRLGLETWSFNKRMIRVAQKLGFVLEGTQRQVRKWQDEWLDLHNYGMLREEWERLRRG